VRGTNADPNLSCLFVLTPCASPRTTGTLDQERRQDAAAEALTTFTDSWNRAGAGDTLAPASNGTLYWQDAELVDPSGRNWDGQAAIVQMHGDLWSTVFEGSRLAGSDRRVRGLSSHLMIADSDHTLTLAGQPPPSFPAGPVNAHLKHAMEKRRDTWKVVAAQNTCCPDDSPSP
jgi:uncharacterized protein (TIGR02246 family)